jgi:hypothetical protein
MGQFEPATALCCRGFRGFGLTGNDGFHSNLTPPPLRSATEDHEASSA